MLTNVNKTVFPSKVQWWGIGFGIVCLLAPQVMSEQVVEQYYSRGFYIFISKLFQVTGVLPFSFSYISIPVLLFLLIYPLIHIWKNSLKIRHKIFRSFFHCAAATGWLAGLFFLLWGYNYGRVPTEKQLGFEEIQISLEELKYYVQTDVDSLMKIRSEIPEKIQLNDLQINKLRSSLQTLLSSQGYPASQRVYCYNLHPKGSLLRWSTSGIFIPFSGQGHIDPGLHPMQKPFVMAHEMAHGYGFTGEGICNFWAYLACMATDDPSLQYSGGLGLWRYMASSWRFYEPETYLEFRRTLPEILQQDLNQINETIIAYPDILPEARDYIYDSFLKSQGLTDGIQNYDKIIPMAIQWRRRRTNK